MLIDSPHAGEISMTRPLSNFWQGQSLRLTYEHAVTHRMCTLDSIYSFKYGTRQARRGSEQSHRVTTAVQMPLS